MLLIEKVIKLLDDFHFGVFREHVKNISKRSYYPLVLIEAIDRDFETVQDSEKLCKDVYDEYGEKTRKKFLQLAHYTFKLTAFLAKNYPDYLQHNIVRIQHLINSGELETAGVLGDLLIEISRKVEDFSTEIKTLEIKSREAYLTESTHLTAKIHERINTLLDYQKDTNELMTFIHKGFDPKRKPSKEDVESNANYLKSFFEHESTFVRLISQYHYCYNFYILRDARFNEKNIFTLLEKVESELKKSDFLLFPYLNDYSYNINFLKLYHLLIHSDGEELMELTAQLLEQKDEILFSNSFINIPKLLSFTFQANLFAGKYLLSYKENFLDEIPPQAKDTIKKLKANILVFLSNPIFKEKYTIRYINLSTTYSLLLLIGTREEIEESINNLEQILLLYQQITFHSYLDSIYSILVTAHFSLKDYEKVDECFRRYKRTLKEKVVNPQNDLILHGFFYASKWLQNKRNQYLKKLEGVLIQTNKPNLSRTNKILKEVIEYYDIPIKIEIKQ